MADTKELDVQKQETKDFDVHNEGGLTDKELNKGDSLLPCPFCGEEAVIENEGTQAEITCQGCYISNGIQISDYFTREERFNDPDFAWQDAPVYGYAPKGKQRAVDVLTELWNTRAPSKELTTTQQKLDVAVEALNEVERLCELTPPLTINGKHSEGWRYLAREIKAAIREHKDN